MEFTMANKFGFKNLGFGMGLRSQHYPYIMKNWPKTVDWFEIISENFMDTDGRPKRILAEIKEHYPIVMHGVSMSIGTTDPLNSEYMKKLKALMKWLNPPWVSDHLCWTGTAHKNTHDLLPVPYTEEALAHIIKKIKHVQDYIERPLIIENPSTYMEFKDSQMPEWEFISRMAEKSSCGLLLDVNNIYVSCYNHRLDPKEYIDALPHDRVVQIHLAGHDNMGTHIIDSHRGKVIDEVWALYRYVIGKAGKISTMIEWDEDVPSFNTVLKEVNKARKLTDRLKIPNQLPDMSGEREKRNTKKPAPYKKSLETFQNVILSGDAKKSRPENWVLSKDKFPPENQLGVYINGYRARLFDVSNEDYKVLRHLLGNKNMNRLLDEYIEATPSNNFNITRYTVKFPEFVKKAAWLPQKIRQAAYEMAVLETELMQISDMKETKPLDTKKFEKMTPEKFLKQKIYLRAALKLFKFDYQVNDYFNKVMDDKNPRTPAKNPCFLAIYRHEDMMWRLEMDKDEYLVMKKFMEGKTVGKAIESMLSSKNVDAEKLIGNFNKWFGRWSSNGLLAEAS